MYLILGIIVGILLAGIALICAILLSRSINQDISKINRVIHKGKLVDLEDKSTQVINKFFKKPNGDIES